MIPLLIFWYWWHDGRLFHVFVRNGHPLKYPVANSSGVLPNFGKKIVEILPSMKSCPNCYVTINDDQNKCDACGVRFHRKNIIRKIPFLPNQQWSGFYESRRPFSFALAGYSGHVSCRESVLRSANGNQCLSGVEINFKIERIFSKIFRNGHSAFLVRDDFWLLECSHSTKWFGGRFFVT